MARGAGLAVATALCLAASANAGATDEHELVRLVRRDCGACHGLTLKGGLGLPLTPDALKGKPADFLAATILDGRPGTAMPPWRPFLTAADAQWIAQWLLEGFPKEDR